MQNLAQAFEATFNTSAFTHSLISQALRRVGPGHLDGLDSYRDPCDNKRCHSRSRKVPPCQVDMIREALQHRLARM